MYYKLVDSCIRFQTMGIEMLGNPRTQLLIGLDEEGAQLADLLLQGSDLETTRLSHSQQALINVLTENKQFVFCEQAKPFRAVYLHVTSKCNMNCPGCYSEYERSTNVELPFPDLTRIIDNLANANVEVLTISGGEPFLRNDIIDLLKYAKQIAKIPRVLCITNGLAGRDVYIEASKYVDTLAFSLDGVSSESSCFRHKSHDKVVDAIKHLSFAGYTSYIIFTLHKKNLRNYMQMKEFANSLGVKCNFSIFATPHSSATTPFEFTEDDIPLLSEAVLNDIPAVEDITINGELGCRDCCGAGSLELSISANGDVFPCHMFFDNEFRLGNALTGNLDSFFLNHRPMFSVDQKATCSQCDKRYICGGGCLFRSYIIHGNLGDRDPLCPAYITHIEKLLLELIG